MRWIVFVLVFVISCFIPMKSVMALEIRGGQSWFENGDYLLHPGVQLTLEDELRRNIQLEFSGRTFGGFTEATAILSLNLPYKVLPWDFIYTHYGVSLLDEYTAYDSPEGKDESIHAFNLGINLGIGWQVWKGDHWDARLEWNSHIFAAGAAFVLMTTARKTVITAAVGYEI